MTMASTHTSERPGAGPVARRVAGHGTYSEIAEGRPCPDVTIAPTLTTERLVLRGPGPQDFDGWADFMASPRSKMAGGPQDRILAWRSFGHMVGHWVLRGFGSFVVILKGDDTAIGMVGGYYPEGWPERELGWTLWRSDAEGRGYAFEAAQAAREWAFADLGWATAVSYINPANARSISLAERLGAVRDREAATPRGEPALVYRHPAPEAVP